MLYGFRRTMLERRRAEENRQEEERSFRESRFPRRSVGAELSETRVAETRDAEEVSRSCCSSAGSDVIETCVTKPQTEKSLTVKPPVVESASFLPSAVEPPTIKQTKTRQAQTDLAGTDPTVIVPSRQMLVSEDEVWIQYGTTDAPDWPSRCVECREAVSSRKRPIAQCINCWKVEVWGSSKWLPRQMDWFDLGEVAETIVWQADALIKVSKSPIHVVRTGIPRDGYPGTDSDYLLMAYAGKISEREELRNSLCVALDMPPDKARQIPVRRGCWLYDEVLGPWAKWYPMDKDMAEE